MTCYCIILQKYKNTVAGIDTKLHLRISYISTLDNTGTERRNFKRILLTVSLSLIYIRHHNPCDYDVLIKVSIPEVFIMEVSALVSKRLCRLWWSPAFVHPFTGNRLPRCRADLLLNLIGSAPLCAEVNSLNPYCHQAQCLGSGFSISLQTVLEWK